MKICTQIITKNNESTIIPLIESIIPFTNSLMIYDIGSTDRTLSLCKGYITKFPFKNDFSEVRNKMIENCKDDWIFVVNPWEKLITNKLPQIKPDVYKTKLINNKTISKEIRIFHKSKNIKFVNPIYETIDCENAKDLDFYIESQGSYGDELIILNKWKKENPLSIEPIYYEAFYYLNKNDWNKFLNLAENYIFFENKIKKSLIMCKYYYSMINLYVKKNHKKALEHLVMCIAEKPTFAEFWCLLGDIYYDLNNFNKAKEFYENGIILGKKRLKSEDYPMNVSKYKEYPEKMIASCEEVSEEAIQKTISSSLTITVT